MWAGATGLEPAASGVTGRRSNQLNYAPAWDIPGFASDKTEFTKCPASFQPGAAPSATTLVTYFHMLPGMGGEAADAMGEALG